MRAATGQPGARYQPPLLSEESSIRAAGISPDVHVENDKTMLRRWQAHGVQSLATSSRAANAALTALLAIALSVSSSKSSTVRATRPFITMSNKAADIDTVCGRPFLVMATGC